METLDWKHTAKVTGPLDWKVLTFEDFPQYVDQGNILLECAHKAGLMTTEAKVNKEHADALESYMKMFSKLDGKGKAQPEKKSYSQLLTLNAVQYMVDCKGVSVLFSDWNQLRAYMMDDANNSSNMTHLPILEKEFDELLANYKDIGEKLKLTKRKGTLLHTKQTPTVENKVLIGNAQVQKNQLLLIQTALLKLQSKLELLKDKLMGIIENIEQQIQDLLQKQQEAEKDNSAAWGKMIEAGAGMFLDHRAKKSAKKKKEFGADQRSSHDAQKKSNVLGIIGGAVSLVVNSNNLQQTLAMISKLQKEKDMFVQLLAKVQALLEAVKQILDMVAIAIAEIDEQLSKADKATEKELADYLNNSDISFEVAANTGGF